MEREIQTGACSCGNARVKQLFESIGIIRRKPMRRKVGCDAIDRLAVTFDRRSFADAAYYNLLGAALATIPVIATGIIAWQLQLEGQKLKGNLLLHLLLGSLSGALIWLVWWLHFRPRKQNDEPPVYRFVIEAVTLLMVMATAHLGGFLSGVNVPS